VEGLSFKNVSPFINQEKPKANSATASKINVVIFNFSVDAI
jgi:hypothetical protein